MAEPATELNSLKRVSIVQQVEQVIADRIVDGTYAVDTKLPAEMTLSKQLGVGRGTVREAFRLLEAKGLVEIRPGRGAFVASDKEAGTEQTVQWFRANEMELLDCVQVRNALEPLAARLMAERSSPRICWNCNTSIKNLSKQWKNRMLPPLQSMTKNSTPASSKPVGTNC